MQNITHGKVFMRIIILVLSLFVVSQSYAQDQSSGCGLGWQVTQKNSLFSSFIRSLTNATFMNSIAMTSGTSGCSKHSIVQRDKMPIHFAESNFDMLVTQMSQGQGEVLVGFAEVMGCQSAGFSEFNKMTKKGIKKLYELGNPTASDLVQAVRVQMFLNPNVSSHCKTTT